jgi:5-formyltetrahydrofolate cyclo-ligase
MTRKEAIEKLAKKHILEEKASELFEYVAAKLEISTQELRNYFNMPLKFYNDYKNQKAIIDFGSKILKFLKVDMLVCH